MIQGPQTCQGDHDRLGTSVALAVFGYLVMLDLATIRIFFDWLIVGQICSYIPAQAVEGPKISAHKGSTPFLDEDSASEFLKSIDVSIYY